MNRINKKACTEVYEILKCIPDEDYEKVPKEIIKHIEENMDKDYKYEIKSGKDFDNSVMLKDTENILAFIFKNYWATEEQNELIQKYRNNKEQIDENNKRKKFNPDDIFKDKTKEIKEENIKIEKDDENKDENKEVEEMSLIEIKDNFFKKLINYLKNLFKLKK